MVERPAAPAATGRRPQRRNPATLPNPPPGPAFLELFAGCTRLSSAIRAAGIRIAVPFEFSRGQQLDICSPKVLAELEAWVRGGLIFRVHFGTPCARWSTARTTGKLDNQIARAGMRCARATVRIIKLCMVHRVRWSLENPGNSGLWQFPPLARLLRHRDVEDALFDMCTFGATWEKPTRISGDLPGLRDLCGRCPGHHRHVQLQGNVTVKTGGRRVSKWRTNYSGAYPPALYRRLATLGRAAAPTAARRRRLEPGFLPCWQSRALGCSRQPTSLPFSWSVDPPKCPRFCDLGWEGCCKQWGGRPHVEEFAILEEHRFKPGERQATACRRPGVR